MSIIIEISFFARNKNVNGICVTGPSHPERARCELSFVAAFPLENCDRGIVIFILSSFSRASVLKVEELLTALWLDEVDPRLVGRGP